MKVSLFASALLGLGLAACGGEEQCDPDAPGTICTIAGNGSSGYGGDNGPALAAKIYAPQDVAISPEGEVWLLDFNNYRIRAIDSAGMIRTVPVNAELELRFSPPLDVTSSEPVNVNVNVDVSSWFRDASGNVIDPRQLNTNAELRAQFRNRVRASFRAFEDGDHDGDESDSDSDSDSNWATRNIATRSLTGSQPRYARATASSESSVASRCRSCVPSACCSSNS